MKPSKLGSMILVLTLVLVALGNETLQNDFRYNSLARRAGLDPFRVQAVTTRLYRMPSVESDSWQSIDYESRNPASFSATFSPQQELLAGDAGEDDLFGLSVALSGDTAVIGAQYHTGQSGVRQGAAYVFVRSGTTWTLQQELRTSDGAAEDHAGGAVAIDGDTVVIGATGHDGRKGAAYVFVRSGTVWTEQQELTASDGATGDEFASAVGISGETAVLGSFRHATGQGAVYVFVRGGNLWTQQQELTANDGVAGDRFGLSVKISGDTVAAGAPDHAGIQGSAYVFARNGTVWTQQQEITGSDSKTDDDFGAAVAINGETAVIGAPGHSGPGGVAGAAYVFVRSGAVWTQQQELEPSDGGFPDEFGGALSISGDTVLVSGPFHGGGRAYLFARSGTTWTQQQELTASDEGSADQFGESVAISGETALVGASGHDGGAGPFQGAAYVFAPQGDLDVCILDAATVRLLRFSQTSGAWQFFDCRKGTTASGQGIASVAPGGCKIMLTVSGKGSTATINATANVCTGVGTSTVILNGVTYVLNDPKVNDGTCSCPAP